MPEKEQEYSDRVCTCNRLIDNHMLAFVLEDAVSYVSFRGQVVALFNDGSGAVYLVEG